MVSLEPSPEYVRSPERPDLNPYAPPRAVAGQGGTRAPGDWITWLYLANQAVVLTALGLIRAEQRFGVSLGALNPVVLGAQRWLACINLVLVCAWLHQAWASVPRPFRRAITPRRAVAYLLVPGYQIYWFFVANARLCAALDAALAHAGDSRRAPTLVAKTAPVASVVLAALSSALLRGGWFFVNYALVFATNLVWVTYVLQCDAARCAVTRCALDGAFTNVSPHEVPAAYRLPRPWLVAVLFLALSCFALALWQFLSPGGH